MDCSMPGLPVHHQLPELTQTHVHRVSDAIQPSHPLLSPSPPAFNLSVIRDFSSESVLHIKWSKYWSFNFSISPSNEYSGLISFRMDWLDLLAVQGTLKRDSQEGYLWLVSIIFTVRLVPKEDQKYSYGASLAVQWLRFHMPVWCGKKKNPSYELESLEGP